MQSLAATNYPYVSIWEVLSESEVTRITPDLAFGSKVVRAPRGIPKIVAFSRDGKYIIVGGEGQRAGLWLWRQTDMLDKACEYLSELGVKLSADDWRQYVGEEIGPQTCGPAASQIAP